MIEGALQHIPRKWSNVQALYLRTAESAALPIYQVHPDAPEHTKRAGSMQHLWARLHPSTLNYAMHTAAAAEVLKPGIVMHRE